MLLCVCVKLLGSTHRYMHTQCERTVIFMLTITRIRGNFGAYDLTFPWLPVVYHIEKTPRLFVDRCQRIGGSSDLTIAEENGFSDIFGKRIRDGGESRYSLDQAILAISKPNGLLRVLSIHQCTYPPTLAIVTCLVQLLTVTINSYNKLCTLLQKYNCDFYSEKRKYSKEA